MKPIQYPETPLIAVILTSIHRFNSVYSLYIMCVTSRTPPQRSVSMWSSTSVRESKDVMMKKMCLLASAFGQLPQRCVNVCVCAVPARVWFWVIQL